MTHTVVIAPDSFKGTIGAAAAAAARSPPDGARVRPSDDVRLLPMADGGEGTVDAFAAAVPGARRMPVTRDRSGGHAGGGILGPPPAEPRRAPRNRRRRAREHERHRAARHPAAPAGASTRTRAASARRSPTPSPTGCRGSCWASARARRPTAARACSRRWARDSRMPRATPIADGARGLAAVSAADLSGLAPLPSHGVTVLSDVTNPLLGARGAAAVFGPQKGAAPDDIAALDAGLARLAGLAAFAGTDPDAAGAGAAGGTGFGLLAWGATLVPGLGRGGGPRRTRRGGGRRHPSSSPGEGSYDGQSAAGKVPGPRGGDRRRRRACRSRSWRAGSRRTPTSSALRRDGVAHRARRLRRGRDGRCRALARARPARSSRARSPSADARTPPVRGSRAAPAHADQSGVAGHRADAPTGVAGRARRGNGPAGLRDGPAQRTRCSTPLRRCGSARERLVAQHRRAGAPRARPGTRPAAGTGGSPWRRPRCAATSSRATVRRAAATRSPRRRSASRRRARARPCAAAPRARRRPRRPARECRVAVRLPGHRLERRVQLASADE